MHDPEVSFSGTVLLAMVALLALRVLELGARELWRRWRSRRQR